MSKRARLPSPRYLHFVHEAKDGWTPTSRLDLSSTSKAEEIEALFDRIFLQRKQERREADRTNGSYHIPYHVLLYIDEIRNGEVPKEIRQDLERANGLEFPFDWNKEDWGKWDVIDPDERPMTEGKHYWYNSWW